MSDPQDYRTRDEIAEQDADERRIEAVLDRARANGAADFDEEPDVVEMWVDRLWDGLRDNLDPEQRLHAIVMLLNRDMRVAAARLTRIEGRL